ncbi:probable NAD(P)H-dependent oxidoreductase 2 [Lycium ferocissimum]|uniref:probable NAD(P)H-dependent oxidoreductase 2 n=1 Tax=Lycium ferocissimum TaxID=112874 RepID=UPI002815E255|nr:probable NAD(P)H-dependent oxidoreductase 2 [Lycium ferocissimum]
MEGKMRSYQTMLNNGETLPIMGLGTYSGENDRETTEKAIRTAIKMGYRHFDTAKICGSEQAVGNALRRAISDERLGMEYIDMYLVHWPVALKPWVDYPIPKEEDFEEFDMENTMERCLEMGLCRSIGVSNFPSKKIEELLDFACVAPAEEMHPMWRQRKLRAICRDYEIHVALRWGLSQGSSVIVKSFNPRRMKENIGALHLKLDEWDLLDINKMEERKIMRGECLSNDPTSPYRTIEELWDGEI